ncbi:MAG: DNA recombination protein RmuC [Hyphomicrobiales bacterium]|nr:MAG: DNA recombination protein RmuC [Hyphomicrobiales bacterium]
MDSVLFMAGERPVMLGEALAAAALAGLVLLLARVVIAMRQGRERREAAAFQRQRSAELELQISRMVQAQNEQSGRLQAMSEAAMSREAEMSRSLNERLDAVTMRLGQSMTDSTKQTTESLGQLQARLAVIDAAQKNITELSGQVVSLQDILSDKQSRGAFGQGRMETIIRDGLPSDAYEFQVTLSNGKRPDCLIRLPNTERAIVIDAKFPLEAFSALEQSHEDAGIREARARIRTDMLKHINDISSKYLLAGETQDMAIMFVPSESIYATLYEAFEDLIQKSYRARVIIVSPNMLMLAVHTMQAVLKDAKMREQAHLIQGEVVRLMDDVHRLRDRVLALQRHFSQANGDIDKILISADKITNRGRKIENVDLAEDGEEVLDAAPAPQRLAGE